MSLSFYEDYLLRDPETILVLLASERLTHVLAVEDAP